MRGSAVRLVPSLGVRGALPLMAHPQPAAYPMSIEASYRRITPGEFTRLQADPKAAESFFGTSLDDLDDPEQEQVSVLTIDTSWAC